MVAAPKEFKSLWGKSTDRAHMLPPAVVAGFEKSTRQSRSAARAALHDKVVVRNPVPKRKEDIQDNWGHLTHCRASKKNVCRQHGMSRGRARDLDAMCAMLSCWANTMSLEARSGASELAMIVDDHTPRACVVLLVACHGSPKMQVLARCGLKGPGGEFQQVFERPACPFEVRIMTRAARIGVACSLESSPRVLDLATSDEVADDLVTRGGQWSLHAVQYDIPDEGDLLDMVITAVGPKLEPPRCTAKQKTKSNDIFGIPSSLDVDDPLGLAFHGPSTPRPTRIGAKEHEDREVGSDEELEDLQGTKVCGRFMCGLREHANVWGGVRIPRSSSLLALSKQAHSCFKGSCVGDPFIMTTAASRCEWRGWGGSGCHVQEPIGGPALLPSKVYSQQLFGAITRAGFPPGVVACSRLPPITDPCVVHSKDDGDMVPEEFVDAFADDVGAELMPEIAQHEHGVDESSGDDGHSDGAGLEAASEAIADEAAEDPVELDRPATVDDALAGHSMDANGVVTCPIGPWAALPKIGRLSSWPASAPVSQRSFAMRCYMHTSCSVTKRRQAATDSQFLAWLFASTPLPPGALPQQCKAARDAHMALRFTAFSKEDTAAPAQGGEPRTFGHASSSTGAEG